MAGLSAPARLTRASGIDRDQAERDPDPRRIWPGIYDASARQDDCARFGESETYRRYLSELNRSGAPKATTVVAIWLPEIIGLLGHPL